MDLLKEIKKALLLAPDEYDWRKPEFEITEIYDGFQIKYHCMYNPPAINLDTLISLSNIFGTNKIDVDNYGQSGCESCDYGSDYGHEIQIYHPTKNFEEVKKLIGQEYSVRE